MRIESSEGNCPVCGLPFGIGGTCYACAVEAALDKRKDGPTCKQCGAAMKHSRMNGYRCSRDERHEGIVWPTTTGDKA